MVCESLQRVRVEGQLTNELKHKEERRKKETRDFQTAGKKGDVNEIKEAEGSVQFFFFERAKPVLMETGWLPDGFCQREKREHREENV